MKQMPFEPPTNHYDERIEAIDEQICQLIKQRKELSNNNPGFPTNQHIADWSKKYNFYDDFLNSIFANFLYEDIYRPVVEPKGYLKNIPILKSFEKDGAFYSVTFVRQFENASIVHLNIDSNYTEDVSEWHQREHTHFELSIKGEETHYNCRNEGGGGTMGHETQTFIVSPALPDDISKYKLIFKEYKMPFQKETGFEFVI
ncbi:hypothetical protein RGU12_12795 [Fredinandcohnia sp. QZ13]|uniref:hypothetical protein n=1 Tax=Fredinandcohnia sp. QZ13 TaxID=3073144 RepID=UPI0028535193|nr:hypothetical protein [Fredinandcohnia sp. QZ13]MDR4888400.1 hypothetical protein [Fredinandcohnia sp. QZ13]